MPHITFKEHWKALRKTDKRFAKERDRRYAEVNLEREKALKIKETADLAALELAREIQTYKDEKANQLREQINSERGHYASKEDLHSAIREINAVIAPLLTFVAAEQGQSTGSADKSKMIALWAGLILAVCVAIATLIIPHTQAPVMLTAPAVVPVK